MQQKLTNKPSADYSNHVWTCFK